MRMGFKQKQNFSGKSPKELWNGTSAAPERACRDRGGCSGEVRSYAPVVAHQAGTRPLDANLSNTIGWEQ